MKEIFVLGGGAAGLSAALTLCEKLRADGTGARVTVLEAAERVGGRMGSEQHGDWRVETGPATLQEGAPGLLPLIERVGLNDEIVLSDQRAHRRYLYVDGKLQAVPGSPPALLRSAILPMGDKLRLLGEPFVKRLPGDDARDETVGAFFRRRLGTAVTTRVIDAVLGGIYAGDIDRLSLRSAMPRVHEMEQQHGSLLRAAFAFMMHRPAGPKRNHLLGFRHGMGQFAAALSQTIAAAGGRILLETPVRALFRNGASWRIHTDGAELTADAVVLCLPPPQAQAVLRPLDAVAADAYAGIPMSPIAAVSLGYRPADVPHPLDGFGFLIPRCEKVRLLGTLFMTSALPGFSQAPPGHVLLRALYGGAHDLGIASLDEDTLVRTARDDLRTTLGITAAPRFLHVKRWTQGIEQYVVGHHERVATIEERLADHGLYAAGAALHGISVADVLRNGQAVAEKLVHRMHAN